MAVSLDRAPAPAPGAAPARRRGRVLRGLGRLSLAAGAVVLLFVAYERWGTGLVTARHQAELRRQLQAGGLPDYRLGPNPRAVPAGPGDRPIPGGAVGFIRIPRIGLDMVFVEGVDPGSLKRGPGHHPATPLPGQGGNVSIAGHRTTYARPFWALDELRPGDRIVLETRKGRFAYEVSWSRVVDPDASWVLAPTDVPSLTLTTCAPRFSASRRLVVRAVQVSGPGVGR
jgi:sortase A